MLESRVVEPFLRSLKLQQCIADVLGTALRVRTRRDPDEHRRMTMKALPH